MKQIFCLLLLSLLFLGKSFGQKKLLLGSWKIVTVNGNAPSDSDKNLTLVFHADGKMEMANEVSESITWVLSKDNKEIKATIEADENKLEVVLKIISLDKQKMTLDNKGSIAVFEKEGKAAKAQKTSAPKPTKLKLKGDAKKIVGTWEVSEEGAPKMILQFNADGTVWANGPGSGDVANWKVSEDGKQIIIIEKNREEGANFTLSSDYNTLTINVENRSMNFKRTKEKLTKPDPKKIEQTDPVVPIEPIELPENSKMAKEADLIGEWKVISIDQEVLEERVMIIKINKDKSFIVLDNGNVERTATWSINSSGGLHVSDPNNYQSDFITVLDPDGILSLTDYYGTFRLKKQ